MVTVKYTFIFFVLAICFSGCETSSSEGNSLKATNSLELAEAIAAAQPGDEIVMANGNWKDVQIRFTGFGTSGQPITLRAETPGQVIIEGESDLKLAGEFLVVKGLHFRDGHSPSSAVIEFQTDDENFAFNCKVTECVIENFNQLQRNKTDLWVRLRGRYNQLDHCYLAGKSNRGPTVRVDLEGIESVKNYHKITNNHFGPRPPKGGPSAETIQIGDSYTSMSPSYTLVANNFFERCNGEVEIISSKSNFNEFRNNIFYKSEGSLVTRHGNYCQVDGNYFIGDENSENIGGIRLIGTGHWVTNNYFYQLKGQNFRSPLAVMNGIPKSPLNRYIQVTDVVIAYNSWINCKSPLQFGVGSNVDQKDVLPASEIRSDRPIRTTVANNLVYNETADDQPLVAHDRLDGINFQSNVINNQGGAFEGVEGLDIKTFEVKKLGEYVFAPAAEMPEVKLYAGFEFKTITMDLFGNPRAERNAVGAISSTATEAPNILNKDQYGPTWYAKEATPRESKTHAVTPSANDLMSKLAAAEAGDIVELAPGTYEITAPLVINQAVQIQSKDLENRAIIVYSGPATTPAFEMNPKGQLTLSNIILNGKGEQYAFATLKSNMSSLYNLSIDNCEISGFDFVLKAYKYSFSEHLDFTNTTFKDCNNGIELSEETEDKGEYNAENIKIDNCRFERVDQNVLDYYRGGYDESTVGGNLLVTNSEFVNCGAKEPNGILLNTYGIINVALRGNTFLNNRVKLVALLWGAKNNTHADNTITNSGEIRVEENLKLNLLY